MIKSQTLPFSKRDLSLKAPDNNRVIYEINR